MEIWWKVWDAANISGCGGGSTEEREGEGGKQRIHLVFLRPCLFSFSFLSADEI